MARCVIAGDAQQVGVREHGEDGQAGGGPGGENLGEGGELVRREGDASRVVEGTAKKVRIASGLDGGHFGRERLGNPRVAEV